MLIATDAQNVLVSPNQYVQTEHKLFHVKLILVVHKVMFVQVHTVAKLTLVVHVLLDTSIQLDPRSVWAVGKSLAILLVPMVMRQIQRQDVSNVHVNPHVRMESLVLLCVLMAICWIVTVVKSVSANQHHLNDPFDDKLIYSTRNTCLSNFFCFK